MRIDMTLDLYTGSVPSALREAVSRLGDVFAGLQLWASVERRLTQMGHAWATPQPFARDSEIKDGTK